MIDFKVADKAWEKIKKVLMDPAQNPPGDPKTGIRLKVVGGGCSGLQYNLGFDNKKQGDFKIEKDGYFVYIDSKSFLHLKGTTLDYQETLQTSGFVIQNPNVTHSCGCGKSFTT